jgi:hypothetical protein
MHRLVCVSWGRGPQGGVLNDAPMLDLKTVFHCRGEIQEAIRIQMWCDEVKPQNRPRKGFNSRITIHVGLIDKG